MPIRTEDFAQVEIGCAQDLWAWLGAHHAQEESIWLVTAMKSDPSRYVGREEVLDALVAFGWVDGIRRKLSETRTMQLISPRQQQAWSKSYKDRAEQLSAEGRMRDPGRARIEAGKASGLWDYFADVDALIAPEDLVAGLGAHVGQWEALPPSYRRNVLRWIKVAKTPATRSKRIGAACKATASGARLPQM